MSLQVYNTLSSRKSRLKPSSPQKVSMYVCGPTVYDKAHVGHAMSILIFDTSGVTWNIEGLKVNQVMNYTDVDDKIISGRWRKGKSRLSCAERYIAALRTICLH